MSTAITARGVCRDYGPTRVVEDVDLDVNDGEVLGLVGPNGGGKSTLLMMLAGLVRPTTGSVKLGDTDAVDLALDAAGSVGLITAEPGLYPALTVRENLHWFAGLYGLTDIDTRMAPWLEVLDLHPHLDRPVAALSSGQRQKVSLVRALLLQPRVLLFDEPTANLDPLSARTLYAQVRARADAGTAVVLCTHDLHAASAVCDRVAVLNRTLHSVQILDGPRGTPPESPLHQAFSEACVPPEPEQTGPSRTGAAPAPPVLHIARREWTETLRHPGILGICATLLVLLGGITATALGLLQLVIGQPAYLPMLAELLGDEATAHAFLDGAVRAALTAYNFLIFSQYLGFVGVIAGHSLLHDRQSGTLPFLLLAPVRRLPLLAGKVLGALVPLTAVYVGISGLGGLLTTLLPVAAEHPELGPRSAAWWLALLVAGPAWAAFVATACAGVSAIARDVRLAQQGVWFVVFFVQLLVAFLITGSLGSTASQLVAAALGAVATALALFVGASTLSRDLGR